MSWRWIIAKVDRGGFPIWVRARTKNLNTQQPTFLSDSGIEGDHTLEFHEFETQEEADRFYESKRGSMPSYIQGVEKPEVS